MSMFRALGPIQRRLFVVLFAASLAMRALMAAGFMPASNGQILTFELCQDSIGGSTLRTVKQWVPNTDSSSQSGEEGGTDHDDPCPFAYGAQSLAPNGRPLPVLAMMPSRLLLQPSRPHQVTLASRSGLRPPLRGPPRNS